MAPKNFVLLELHWLVTAKPNGADIISVNSDGIINYTLPETYKAIVLVIKKISN